MTRGGRAINQGPTTERVPTQDESLHSRINAESHQFFSVMLILTMLFIAVLFMAPNLIPVIFLCMGGVTVVNIVLFIRLWKDVHAPDEPAEEEE